MFHNVDIENTVCYNDSAINFMLLKGSNIYEYEKD